MYHTTKDQITKPSDAHRTSTNQGIESPVNRTSTKAVEYAYPTSSNAKRFGHYSVGCYTVALIDGIRPPKAIAAFATLAEAKSYADQMPQPFNRYTL